MSQISAAEKFNLFLINMRFASLYDYDIQDSEHNILHDSIKWYFDGFLYSFL